MMSGCYPSRMTSIGFKKIQVKLQRGRAGEFNGGNSTEGGAGEVSENDCVSYEQTQVNNLNLRMNVSVLNTSRVKIKIPKLAVTETSTVLEKGKATPT